MANLKPICGISEPKKNQRIGTMEECASMRQIRYYGLHKIDKITATKASKTNKPKKTTAQKKPKKEPDPYAGLPKKTQTEWDEFVGSTIGLRSRVGMLKRSIVTADNRGDTKKVKALEKELVSVTKRFMKQVPIANKYIEISEKIRIAGVEKELAEEAAKKAELAAQKADKKAKRK